MTDDGLLKWIPGRVAVDGWDTEDGNYRIIPVKGQKAGEVRWWLLISFLHESEDGQLWTRRFPTVEAAKDHAERI